MFGGQQMAIRTLLALIPRSPGVPLSLPPKLLAAVADEAGGRVVLVVGAGCSVEDPTNLPLSRDCALDAHRRLTADGVISEGDCQNSEDLSAVADSVRQATGLQESLVERLPLARFRNAEPNHGHRLAAALMREGTLKAVVTLNFDMALSTALANLGATEVEILSGPQDHSRMGQRNLVYLHRNVDAAPEEWILSTDALGTAWQGQWEEVIAGAMLSAPVTIFAGLGSPAAVLVESARRIRAAVPTGVETYQVDPSPLGSSAFSEELQMGEENYIQSGWVDFMKALAARLVLEHAIAIEKAAARVQADQGIGPEDVTPLCDSIAKLDLLELGELRARWMIEKASYLPHAAVDPRHPAQLLLAVALVARVTESTPHFDPSGLVYFEKNGTIVGVARVVAGQGLINWVTLETRLQRMKRGAVDEFAPLGCVIVASVTRPTVPISPPPDLVTDAEEGNILSGQTGPRIVTVEELHADPAIASTMVS